MLGVIFEKDRNKIQDPAKLRQLMLREVPSPRRKYPSHRPIRHPCPAKSRLVCILPGDDRDVVVCTNSS